MPQCPQCKKPLRELVRRCPSCQADLDLLVDFVNHLHGGLTRAEDLTKAGELGQAVWAYLEILEVDPDNTEAKKQVAQVATAVRQFDQAAPGRRWLSQNREGPTEKAKAKWPAWLWCLAITLIVIAAFVIGYLVGITAQFAADNEPTNPEPPAPLKQKGGDSLLG